MAQIVSWFLLCSLATLALASPLPEEHSTIALPKDSIAYEPQPNITKKDEEEKKEKRSAQESEVSNSNYQLPYQPEESDESTTDNPNDDSQYGIEDDDNLDEGNRRRRSTEEVKTTKDETVPANKAQLTKPAPQEQTHDDKVKRSTEEVKTTKEETVPANKARENQKIRRSTEVEPINEAVAKTPKLPNRHPLPTLDEDKEDKKERNA